MTLIRVVLSSSCGARIFSESTSSTSRVDRFACFSERLAHHVRVGVNVGLSRGGICRVRSLGSVVNSRTRQSTSIYRCRHGCWPRSTHPSSGVVGHQRTAVPAAR